MSFLTLEFAILFLNALKINFPLILISLNVVERSLLLKKAFSNRWCEQENVEPDALKDWHQVVGIPMGTNCAHSLQIYSCFVMKETL